VPKLFAKLVADTIVKSTIPYIKKRVGFDLRKFIKFTTADKSLDALWTAKKSADEREQYNKDRKRLAEIDSAQRRVDEQSAILAKSVENIKARLSALELLGLKKTKLTLYRTSLENPMLTQQELAKTVRKDRRTVIRWLQEIESLILI
jgi:hypothetical protein